MVGIKICRRGEKHTLIWVQRPCHATVQLATPSVAPRQSILAWPGIWTASHASNLTENARYRSVRFHGYSDRARHPNFPERGILAEIDLQETRIISNILPVAKSFLQCKFTVIGF